MSIRPSVVFVLLAASALAQDSAPLTFEVASIKINQQFRQDDRGTWLPAIDTSPDRLTMRNVNLTMIVAWAYDVQRPQISGPDGLDSQRYDIMAKASRRADEKEMHQMLQALLAERFKLKMHRETRPMDVLALLLPKGGHKMKQSQGDGPMQSRQDPVLGSVVERADLGEVLKEFSRETTVPVIDMTGLKGRFDFTVNVQKYVQALRARLIADSHPPTDAEARVMILQNVVEGELGLKLEPRRAPVEVVVIDHVELSPLEN